MTKNPTESELSAKVDTTNAEEEGTIEFILYEVWKHTKKSQVLVRCTLPLLCVSKSLLSLLIIDYVLDQMVEAQGVRLVAG